MSHDVATSLFGLAQPDLPDLLLLYRSGLFDHQWFVSQNLDLIRAGVDPLTHYHRWGWTEGRWPNPYFDPAWYLARYRDVRDAGLDPLLHYASCGEAEGRQPIGHFDPCWYRARHRVPPGQLSLAHFLQHRHAGAVSPLPEFDAEFYCRHSPDVAAAGMDPFEHYLVQGASEGRKPVAHVQHRSLPRPPPGRPNQHQPAAARPLPPQRPPSARRWPGRPRGQHGHSGGGAPLHPPRPAVRAGPRADAGCCRRAPPCWPSTCRSSTPSPQTTRGGAQASRSGPTPPARCRGSPGTTSRASRATWATTAWMAPPL